MIRDLEAYRRLCEDEHWQELSRMSLRESIELGEALLTSTLMDISEFPDDDRPMSLARALGLHERRRGGPGGATSSPAARR
jgi:hypothetical protein